MKPRPPIKRECAAVWRAAWPWILLVAGAAVTRRLFDTFDPPEPSGYGPRSQVSTLAAIATFLLAGFVTAARSGDSRILYGPAVAFIAGLGGLIIGMATTAVLYFTVIVKDPTKLATFYMTGGWEEEIGFSILVPLVGMLLGGIGVAIWIWVSGLPPFDQQGPPKPRDAQS